MTSINFNCMQNKSYTINEIFNYSNDEISKYKINETTKQIINEMNNKIIDEKLKEINNQNNGDINIEVAVDIYATINSDNEIEIIDPLNLKNFREINFDVSHLNKEEIINKIKTNDNPDKIFSYYCKKLFLNNNNGIIIKSRMMNEQTDPSFNSRRIQKSYNDCIYYVFINNIFQSLIKYLITCNLEQRYIDKYKNYLEFLCENKGSLSLENKTWKKIYNSNVYKLKKLFNKLNL